MSEVGGAGREKTSEGGCQCGELRYRIEGEPLAVAVCHCTECQRQSGSGFGMSLMVREESFQLLCGTPRDFTREAETGRSVRCAFCPSCGVRIYHDSQFAEGILNIKPGTLDDTKFPPPTVHLWLSSKQPWVSIPEGVQTFDRQMG